MGKGPGLYSDIGKIARGDSSVSFIFASFSCFFFFPLFSFLTHEYDVVAFLLLLVISDLLYRDYQSDHKFTVTTYTSSGVVRPSLDLIS